MIETLGFRDLPAAMGWRQGEHVTAIGPTGSGKSRVAAALLELRDYVCVIGTKPKDDSLDALLARGYDRLESWPPTDTQNRVVLWPEFRGRQDLAAQRTAVADALDAMFQESGWAIYIDELPWVARTLGLADVLEMIWLQGRALDVSLVTAAQRPFSVPQPALSQAEHLFLWQTAEARDLKRLGEISGGLDTAELRRVVQVLPKHAFLYVNVRDRTTFVSKLVLPSPPHAKAA